MPNWNETMTIIDNYLDGPAFLRRKLNYEANEEDILYTKRPLKLWNRYTIFSQMVVASIVLLR